MKLVFVIGKWSAGSRPIDFMQLFTSPRGLTGSEMSFVGYARAMVRRGHDVTLYVPTVGTPSPYNWEGVVVRSIETYRGAMGGVDAVLSWMEPDLLREINPKTLRVVNQQVNDFGYCKEGFDAFVDLYLSPSADHRAYIARIGGIALSKWHVLPNACDMAWYPKRERVPGRVIYASSPDRGLHWLLQQWPEIRKRVPHAELRIFYEMERWLQFTLAYSRHTSEFMRETAFRAHYIQDALRRLEGRGVTHFQSVSRERIAREMTEAMVLAYPCCTTRYTEGFSVTLLEACAAGLAPIATKMDALGTVYGGVVPMAETPISEHLEEWTEQVVCALTDESYREEVTRTTTRFARAHTFQVLAQRLEDLLIEARKSKAA